MREHGYRPKARYHGYVDRYRDYITQVSVY
jgi:hypothetical protein